MNVLLFVNVNKDADNVFTDGIVKLLDKYSVDYRIFKAQSDQSSVPPEMPKGADAVFVLGGDGTVLHAVRELSKTELPIFGINIGRLGFLTEVEYKDFETALQKILNGDYFVEERMLLNVTDNNGASLDAVNDVCVINQKPGKIVHLDVAVNNRVVESLCGDGVIVSSPTGSTAYSMSAGGPIVSPVTKCLILTPICPHSFYAKPLVLQESDVINITVRNRGHGIAILDGQNKVDVESISVKKSGLKSKYIRFKDYNFFDVLSRKFNNRNEISKGDTYENQ